MKEETPSGTPCANLAGKNETTRRRDYHLRNYFPRETSQVAGLRVMAPRELANSICETLLRAGHQALLVGGCVRDILLDRKPADYDVATDATPDQVMTIFPGSVAVGAQFGVIAVSRNGLKVEVATFRTDAGYSDGRHPDSVVYARTPKENVQTRDVTITGWLQVVLPEVAGWRGVEPPPQFQAEGDVWIRTRLRIERLPAVASPTLAWGVLLHDVGKPPTFKSARETGDSIRFNGHVDVGISMAQEIARRLRFSNEDTEQIVALVANHMRFKDVELMRASTLKRFVRLPRFDEHLELHRLDGLSSHGRLDSYGCVQRILADAPPNQIRPPPMQTGRAL